LGMKTAIEKARHAGVGVVTVRNSDFIGTCAHSAMLAVEAGMIGLTWTNGFPGMAPWGGRRNGIGNNPVAFAIPAGSGAPVVLDIAMSVVAGGKVRHAAKTGKPIPTGWVVDADGNDTERPEDLPQGGALLAMGHKGYGLAVVGEVLAGALAGAAMLGAIPQWFTATDQRVGNGHFHLAIDIHQFIDPAAFAQQMDAMASSLKAVKRRPGIEEILLPGEAAARREAVARSEGLAIPAEVMADLKALARRFGLPSPRRLI
jgi:LDH2 family malate/lactate/ureidoglycolate dehydrogenase